MKYCVHLIFIITNGKKIFEQYFNGNFNYSQAQNILIINNLNVIHFFNYLIYVYVYENFSGFPESKNMKLFSVQPTASFHYDISNLESMDLISLNTSVNKLNSKYVNQIVNNIFYMHFMCE